MGIASPHPYLSCVIRTTTTRRPLADVVIAMIKAYAARAPTTEIILALDAGDVNWTALPHTVTSLKTPDETVWQHLHRKYRDGFTAARGVWVVCVDDDDWFAHERLRFLSVDHHDDVDVVYTDRVYVHELRSPARRTYCRVMTAPGLLESTVAFRRTLLDQHPLDEPELGLWVQTLRRAGARIARRWWSHVMFLHGANADLGAGRTGLRVGAADRVLDGPAEYTVIGGRADAYATIGDALLAWEAT